MYFNLLIISPFHIIFRQVHFCKSGHNAAGICWLPGAGVLFLQVLLQKPTLLLCFSPLYHYRMTFHFYASQFYSSRCFIRLTFETGESQMPHILLIPEKMKLVGAWKMGPDSSSEVNSLFCFFLILLIPASFPWNGIENMPGNLGNNKKRIKVCILYKQWPLQGNNRGLNLIISSWSILQLFHTEKKSQFRFSAIKNLNAIL